ncbi:hypothetical protein XENTR_v10017044 [Xenopus tropicalis]|nr:hypothetical protein XENTR_v10017044 [Xenopus tropicalis]
MNLSEDNACSNHALYNEKLPDMFMQGSAPYGPKQFDIFTKWIKESSDKSVAEIVAKGTDNSLSTVAAIVSPTGETTTVLIGAMRRTQGDFNIRATFDVQNYKISSYSQCII